MKNKFYPAHKSIVKSTSLLLSMACLVVISFSSCKKNIDNDNNEPYNRIQPKGPKPEWAPTITPQMLTVIETLDTIAPIPIFNLMPQQARQQPSPADAVMRVMRNFNIPVPPMKVDTVGRDIPVMGGQGLCHKQPF